MLGLVDKINQFQREEQSFNGSEFLTLLEQSTKCCGEVLKQENKQEFFFEDHFNNQQSQNKEAG